MKISPYAKACVAAAIAVLTVVASAITDSKITDAEWVNIGLAIAAAVGVYRVPNKPAT